MEALQGDERREETDTDKPGPETRASDEAIAFMSGIEPAELPKCVFTDSLVTVSEGGRELGRFRVSMEFARRARRPCMLLHAQSEGAVDDSPCGTTVTAYLTADLEVLEEDYHEYVKLEGHVVDKRCRMVQRGGKTKIDKVTTVGTEVTKESFSFSTSALRGLVTEGSNFLLMRLIALRRKVPEHLAFICFDQKLRIVRTTFRELEEKQMQIGEETVEIFGVERVIHSVDDTAVTWQCCFLPDGHLASRVQVGCPVMMKLLQLPSQTEEVFGKMPLVWEEDIQMRSKFLDRKTSTVVLSNWSEWEVVEPGGAEGRPRFIPDRASGDPCPHI
ncbi:ciliogenesis-associated TTC17-interacting protein isoform X3 [Nerophis ophidion]|uniref:ciliogenesis-associated TTC17-interacting protein isoform X3 n=1 Tax=Nerophis ophidion TaxID=159077 RepID=UPI002ADF8BB9|nr:ciliogenesis-associated TTC17-interacting protein isoform X3 [Nerophis ophidion]